MTCLSNTDGGVWLSSEFTVEILWIIQQPSHNIHLILEGTRALWVIYAFFNTVAVKQVQYPETEPAGHSPRMLCTLWSQLNRDGGMQASGQKAKRRKGSLCTSTPSPASYLGQLSEWGIPSEPTAKRFYSPCVCSGKHAVLMCCLLGTRGSFLRLGSQRRRWGQQGLGESLLRFLEAMMLFFVCSGWPFEASRVVGMEGAWSRVGKTGIQWGSSIREAGVETFPHLDRSEVTGVSRFWWWNAAWALFPAGVWYWAWATARETGLRFQLRDWAGSKEMGCLGTAEAMQCQESELLGQLRASPLLHCCSGLLCLRQARDREVWPWPEVEGARCRWRRKNSWICKFLSIIL